MLSKGEGQVKISILSMLPFVYLRRKHIHACVHTVTQSHTHTELKKKKTHDSITTNKQMNQSKIELKT